MTVSIILADSCQDLSPPPKKPRLERGEILLVYDLGGGTFDVALLQKKGDGFEHLAVPAGIERCGGVDFDRAIYTDLVRREAELQEALQASRDDKQALVARLSIGEMCIDLKHQLSDVEDAELAVVVPGTGTFVEYALKRTAFEGMITHAIEETIACCRQMIQRANLTYEQLNRILLVGGSCRIPHVQQMLKQEFKRPISMAPDLELVVCQGAALYANRPKQSLHQNKAQTLQNLSSGKTSSTFQSSLSPDSAIKSVTVASSGADYRSINEAIKHVPEKTRILVRPGTYIESIVLDKNVEVVGDGPREQITLISNDANCIRVATDLAVVRGMTIHGRAQNQYAIDIPRGRFHLSDCIVTCETHSCIGIHNSTAQPLIQRCIIRDSGGDDGIVIYDQGAGVIEDCDIFANKDCEVGIGVKTGGKSLVRRCKIHDAQVGIAVVEQGEGTFEDCDIFANKYCGVTVQTGGKPLVRRCQIHDGQQGGIMVCDQGEGAFEDCDIFANKDCGVAVQTGGKPLVRRCQIHNGDLGIYVQQQGEGIFEDCDIFVNKLSGVQVETGGKPLVRRCQVHNGDLGICAQQQGEGTFEDCDIFANKDCEVVVQTGGKPIMCRCQIHDGQQGGIMVRDQGKGTFEDCDIFANKVCGVQVDTGGKPLMRRCQIHDTQKGAGIYVCKQGIGTFEDCKTFANDLCGLYIASGLFGRFPQGGQHLVVRRCTFRDGEKRGL